MMISLVLFDMFLNLGINRYKVSLIKEARDLAINQNYEDALEVIDKVDISMKDSNTLLIPAFSIKAFCYANLGNNEAARRCADIIINIPIHIYTPYKTLIKDATNEMLNLKKELS